MEIKVVTKAEAVSLLQLWEMKGHGAMDTVRVFTLDNPDGARAGVQVGFRDYQDMEALVLPEHMNRLYDSYQHAFTALGAMFDALDAANAADQHRDQQS